MSTKKDFILKIMSSTSSDDNRTTGLKQYKATFSNNNSNLSRKASEGKRVLNEKIRKCD